MSHGFIYATANRSKPCNPMSGKPLVRPAHQVFGYTAQQKAEWALAIAVRDIAAIERHYTACCAELGKANACRPSQRAAAKSSAFRLINRARAQRRAAVKALIAAQAAVLAFAPVALAA
jgi:hypothetical protein